MRVLVYGAGAIGGYLGALLAQHGADVTLVARGRTLDALGTHGVRLEWASGRTVHARPRVVGPGQTGGGYDLVFVTLKATQLADAGPDLMAAVGSTGTLVMIQNGLPWWYFDRFTGPGQGTRLRSLDPDGGLAAAIDLDRVVGAVIYKPVMARAPGRLFLPEVMADKLIVGELDGVHRPRLEAIAALLEPAGMPVEITPDIRSAKWTKLLVNLVWNPLTALTQSPSGAIAAYPPAADLVRAMMAEGAAVAASVGVQVEADAEAELKRVHGNMSQLPSMLQDVRAGRPLEWQAILGAVVEIAEARGVPVPCMKNIAACVGVLDLRLRSDGAGIAPHAASN
jgi:2-dehydropantoate 2-reductase